MEVRFAELVHLGAVYVKLNGEFMAIHIARSKSDKVWKGDKEVARKTSAQSTGDQKYRALCSRILTIYSIQLSKLTIRVIVNR